MATGRASLVRPGDMPLSAKITFPGMRSLSISFILVCFTAAAFGGDPRGDGEALARALAGKTLPEKGLLPAGFLKAAEAKGDLDADGIEDLALIVHRAPKREAGTPDGEAGGGTDEDVFPQTVLIFKGNASGGFTLWKSGGSHFLESGPNQMETDGVAEFAIKKGVLTISSSTAMSMGGWQAGGCTQKWRNGKSGFRLIGLTISDFSRACGCGTTIDANYLTGLTISSSDRGEDGSQADKETITRKKGKPRVIPWEKFDYDSMCASG